MHIGDKAPQFTIATDTNEEFVLDQYQGSYVVLFFYPKDDTPGCTKEAIAFSESLDQFKAHQAIVIGVSIDSIENHKKFRQKYDLKVLLGSDETKALVEKYGVWVEKSMYGRKYMGTERATFLINPQGNLSQIWRKVKVPGHVEAVLKEIVSQQLSA